MREYGSDFPSIALPDGYFNTFNQYGICTWLQTGREALYLIALDIKQDYDEPVILIPAYSCDSMVRPFSKAGWRIIFYRLNLDLSVDIDYLNSILIAEQPKAILTMNYFGAVSTDKTISAIKQISPSCICIEDFSHCTFSFSQIYNTKVDYYVSSIRKSIGVCDGAVIISKKPLNERLIIKQETEFSNSRLNNQRVKAQYLYTQNPLQKKTFLNGLKEQEEKLNEFSEIHYISEIGKTMLGVINGNHILQARKENMRHILDLIKGRIENIPGIENCLSGAPFSLPIIVENRNQVQNELAKKGLYAPVLWPISEEAKKICSVATKMSDKMLSIPIDQRYNFDDIEEIASIILSNI